MPPLNQVLVRAIAGALIGVIVAVIIAILLYTVFFQGGYQFMDVQMIPIYLVLGSIGAIMGAVLGAGSILVRQGSRPEPPSRS